MCESIKNQLTELETLLIEKGELNCQDIESALGELVEGELCKSAEERVLSHIDSCHECHEGYRMYKEVISIATTLRCFREPEGQDFSDSDSWPEAKEEELPDEVSQRLRSALSQRLGFYMG
jgi:anti-sigma factor RsiW